MIRKSLLTFLVAVSLVLCVPFVSMARTTSELSFVTIVGNISEKRYSQAISNYCKVPENVRENFQLSGWTLTVTTEELEDTMFSYLSGVSICAGIDTEKSYIILESTYNGTRAVVHEMGHYVDFALSNISSTDDWYSIYIEESSGISAYATTSPSECFAEAYDLTYRSPKEFKKSSPKAYKFCLDASSQLKGVD